MRAKLPEPPVQCDANGMLLYIHGFGSSAHSYKAQALVQRGRQRGLSVVCPNLPNAPQLAVQTLCDWVEQTQPSVLVGSSLGGYYARYLAHRYDRPAALINPALRPYERLQEAIGQATHYFDQTPFEWTRAHCDALIDFDVTQDDQTRLWLLTQLGDEILDAQQAIDLLPDARHTIEPGGDHSFVGFDRYLDQILDFNPGA